MLESLQLVCYSTVLSLKFLYVGMKGLCPLLPHDAKPNVPMLEHMVLKDVELGEHSGVGEVCSVKPHEVVISLPEKKKKKFKIKEICSLPSVCICSSVRTPAL